MEERVIIVSETQTASVRDVCSHSSKISLECLPPSGSSVSSALRKR